MSRRLLYISWGLLFYVGCDETTATIDARCEIEVIDPVEDWIRGTDVVLQAYPLSSIIDTTIFINENEIPILNLDTSTDTCTECSTCREAELCTTCGFCEACALTCADCLHEVELIIPIDLQQAPEYLLTIVNGFGSSSPTAINILDPDVSE